MAAAEVVIVQTGTANLASVIAGLRRAGAAPRLAETAADVASAARVVLPGVGAFGTSMGRLCRDGTGQAIRQRVEEGKALLAICVGLQLLCSASEESPGVDGLRIAEGRLERFSEDVQVPQLGWNRVEPTPGFTAAPAGFAYFANSYRLCRAPSGWEAAVTEHGGPFVAAMQRQRVLACQFHPELSGAWGLALLTKWVKEAQA